MRDEISSYSKQRLFRFVGRGGKKGSSNLPFLSISIVWDVSGFVRLFYILSKKKVLSHFPKNINCSLI